MDATMIERTSRKSRSRLVDAGQILPTLATKRLATSASEMLQAASRCLRPSGASSDRRADHRLAIRTASDRVEATSHVLTESLRATFTCSPRMSRRQGRRLGGLATPPWTQIGSKSTTALDARRSESNSARTAAAPAITSRRTSARRPIHALIDAIEFDELHRLLSARQHGTLPAARLNGRANGPLRVPRVVDLDERPAAEAAVVVHRRHPERPRRGDLGGLVLLLLASDFDDQVQQVVRAVAVVDAGDEVGDVVAAPRRSACRES